MSDDKLESQDLKKQADDKDMSAKIKTSMPNWVASLGVAAMLIIALQLTFVFQPNQDEVLDPEIFDSIPNAITVPHWVIKFTFKPNAKWREISNTLASVKGVIIDGPSGKGLVRVAIAKETGDANESQALLTRLKSQPSVASVILEE
tara:strand:+ start:1653 stop:2093 length:441 start_codon:yes stop_codon:yes gene_type:complete